MHDAIQAVRKPTSRDAIVTAATQLFLDRGFDAVNMDELARAAGVARRTLYNQFASKEEIFREMLRGVSAQLENAFPPGLETQGDAREVLRTVARTLLDLHNNKDYIGFLRMVVADSRVHPWIAAEFAAVMDPQTDRLIRLLAHLTSMKVLNCRNPTLAAHQFMGMVNDVSLWPMMLGRDRIAVDDDEIVEETVRMFLAHYGAATARSPRR